jgi:molecular chaperone GrpE (heat shock protein)
MRRLGLLLACAASLSLVVGPAVADDELDVADQRVEELEGELAEATDGYERTWAELEATRVEVEQLELEA